jgi:THUMP domain-like
VPAGAEAQWVSVAGEVVEAGLWFGMLARDGVRRAALVLPPDPAAAPAEVTDVDLPETEVGDGVASYLYEPDGAVIRAGLIGHVAAVTGGRLLDATIAYVSADRLVRTPLAHGYSVEDVFPFQLKTLRTWLRDRGIGRLTIKKRGTAVEPDQLRRQLRLSGEAEATIVLTRVAGRQSVLAVRPLR